MYMPRLWLRDNDASLLGRKNIHSDKDLVQLTHCDWQHREGHWHSACTIHHIQLSTNQTSSLHAASSVLGPCKPAHVMWHCHHLSKDYCQIAAAEDYLHKITALLRG